jgi:hypothetical protein
MIAIENIECPVRPRQVTAEYRTRSTDAVVKSRHSGENRSPGFRNDQKILDPGFHRDDSKGHFWTFYEIVNTEYQVKISSF